MTRRKIGGGWQRMARGAVPLMVAALLIAGCGTRYQRLTLQDTDDATVVLRAEIKHGKPVDHHYRQPATIAAIRLTHILAAIDVRKDVSKDERGQREAAVPTPLLYPMGDMLSQALAKADSSQQIVVMALRKQRRLGVFTEKYLTSLIAFVDDQNRLQLHFFKIDWLVPKAKEDQLREPRLGHGEMKFHVLPGEHIEPIGPQAVAVDWQDPYFRNASIIRVTPAGTVVRRTILMESPAPPAAKGQEQPQQAVEPEIPTEPSALRALADLEEARRAGKITESEYQRRRQEILDQAEKH